MKDWIKIFINYKCIYSSLLYSHRRENLSAYIHQRFQNQAMTTQMPRSWFWLPSVHGCTPLQPCCRKEWGHYSDLQYRPRSRLISLARLWQLWFKMLTTDTVITIRILPLQTLQASHTFRYPLLPSRSTASICYFHTPSTSVRVLDKQNRLQLKPVYLYGIHVT